MADLNKPRSGTIRFRVELVEGNPVDDVFRKPTNHAKQAEKFQVEEGCGTNISCQEHDNTFRGVLVELLEIKQSLLVMRMKDANFRLVKSQ